MDWERMGRFWLELLGWAAGGGLRSLPWRGEQDAYRIVVAEVIMRRTGAERAANVYRTFLEKWPEVRALARTDPLDVEAFFRPLGMPARGRLLQQAACEVVGRFGGRFPNSRAELLGLPGIGPYIADAVLCFAYGHRVVPVDAGVARVCGRALGILSPRRRPWMDPAVGRALADSAPADRIRECAYAILDVAGIFCRPQRPHCAQCPAEGLCATRTAVRAEGGGTSACRTPAVQEA